MLFTIIAVVALVAAASTTHLALSLLLVCMGISALTLAYLLGY